MKSLLLLAVCCTVLSCTKQDGTDPVDQTNIEDVTGTWMYIGYGGGLAGTPFTPVPNSDDYLQFDSTSKTFVAYNGGVKSCGAFSFQADSSSYRLGVLTLDPFPLTDKYDVYLSHDTLSLYPHNFSDAFSSYYVISSRHFDDCSKSSH